MGQLSGRKEVDIKEKAGHRGRRERVAMKGDREKWPGEGEEKYSGDPQQMITK